MSLNRRLAACLPGGSGIAEAMRTGLAVVLASVLAVAPSPSVRAQASADTDAPRGEDASRDHFEVRLHRPMAAGERYAIEHSYEQRITSVTRVNRREQSRLDRGHRVRLEAVAEVRSVDDAGRPLDLRLRVRKCEYERALDGLPERPLEIGTEFRVWLDDAGRLQLEFGDGRMPDATLVAALKRLSGVSAKPGAVADELLAPPGPQRVGDRWTVDREAIAADLTQGGLEAESALISGKAGLEESLALFGGQAIRCSWWFSADDLTPPPAMRKLPYGASADRVNLRTEGEWTVPVDPASPSMSNEVTTTFTLLASGRAGAASVDYEFVTVETINRFRQLLAR